jgi:hypothetical protein
LGLRKVFKKDNNIAIMIAVATFATKT